MQNVEEIHEWRGQEVLDRDGEKVGKLDEVYYDAGGDAVFASVKSGLMGRHNHLVSLAGAGVSRDHIRVVHALAEIKDVEVGEHDGLLDPDGVRRAAHVYGITLDPEARYESATVLHERRAEAAQASERADELERIAGQRAQEAEVSRGQAHDAGQNAAVADDEREEAQRAAAEARLEAERASRTAPPPPGS